MRKIRVFVLLGLGWKASCFTTELHFLSRETLSSSEGHEIISSRRLATSTILDASATGLVSGTRNDMVANEAKEEDKGRIHSAVSRVFTLIRPRKIIPYGLAFGLGVRVGALRQQSLASTSELVTPVRGTIRRFPILSLVLIAVALRDTWSLIPSWAKPGLLRRRSSSTATEDVDPNDMTSVGNIATKLGAIYQVATSKLSSLALGRREAYAAFLALLLTTGQIKETEAHHRDELYHESGKAADPTEVLQDMDEAFEFADWAYDESPLGTLRQNLDRLDFKLLKHDKTAEPGYVGHYIAVSKKRKLLLVGVKGTSSLEDMLTDCCGSAISYDLPGPFIEGGDTQIRCHEGILLSAERLANDIQPFLEEFALPTDYNMLVTGHSLGAGVAALLMVLLRARIPELRGEQASRVRVLAFASPPVLSYDSALACEPFITTIVNNSDVIPRMSLSNALRMATLLRFIDTRLEEKGMDVQKWKGMENFVRMLVKGKEREAIVTSKELRDRTKRSFDVVDLRDPDHLYVPGRVIHLYDTWSKGTEIGATDRTADRVLVSDGSSNVLRMIELDSRMLSDHMSDAYRGSLKSLLAA